MPLIAKVLLTLALLFAAVEIFGRWSTLLEKRHYGYRPRVRAEKIAAFVTVGFAAGILLVSVWTR